MAITLNDNLRINAPKPIDERYLTSLGGVYPNVAAALAATSGKRHLGLTVLIQDGAENVEYWFRESTLDGDLVVKTSGSGGGGGSSVETFTEIVTVGAVTSAEFVLTYSPVSANHVRVFPKHGGPLQTNKAWDNITYDFEMVANVGRVGVGIGATGHIVNSDELTVVYERAT